MSRRQRTCVMCGRVGTTGIKHVDGRNVCRKTKACVQRACDKAFLDRPRDLPHWWHTQWQSRAQAHVKWIAGMSP